jgi:hypothetical protein
LISDVTPPTSTYFTKYWGESRRLSPEDKLLDEERDDVVSYRRKYWDEHVQVRFSRAVDADRHDRWDDIWKDVWADNTRLTEHDISYLMRIECYERMVSYAAQFNH